MNIKLGKRGAPDFISMMNGWVTPLKPKRTSDEDRMVFSLCQLGKYWYILHLVNMKTSVSSNSYERTCVNHYLLTGGLFSVRGNLHNIEPKNLTMISLLSCPLSKQVAEQQLRLWRRQWQWTILQKSLWITAVTWKGTIGWGSQKWKDCILQRNTMHSLTLISCIP